MSDPSSARRIGKTAVEKHGASPGSRFTPRTGQPPFAVVTWPDVVRALHRDATREAALARYREAAFTPDDFGHQRAAREAMADALTRAEDRCGSDDRLRGVRRRLEWELWP
jgi:hypothetical protein